MTTAPDGPSGLAWHDDTRLLGVGVQAYFFDDADIATRGSFAERSLPVFARATPRLVGSEGQRLVYSAGDLWAQPDAVFEHGEGLLCLSCRRTVRMHIDRRRWASQVRADVMLQGVAEAMVVAGARQTPTAALLRMGNTLLLFAPGPPVLECLATHVADARRYWNAGQSISAEQLARFCEPLLRALPGVAEPVRSSRAVETW